VSICKEIIEKSQGNINRAIECGFKDNLIKLKNLNRCPKDDNQTHELGRMQAKRGEKTKYSSHEKHSSPHYSTW